MAQVQINQLVLRLGEKDNARHLSCDAAGYKCGKVHGSVSPGWKSNFVDIARGNYEGASEVQIQQPTSDEAEHTGTDPRLIQLQGAGTDSRITQIRVCPREFQRAPADHCQTTVAGKRARERDDIERRIEGDGPVKIRQVHVQRRRPARLRPDGTAAEVDGILAAGGADSVRANVDTPTAERVCAIAKRPERADLQAGNIVNEAVNLIYHAGIRHPIIAKSDPKIITIQVQQPTVHIIFRPGARIARRTNHKIRLVTRAVTKGAAILDNRPTPAIAANHKAVIEASGDGECCPGLNDKIAIVGRAIAKIDAMTTGAIDRGAARDDVGAAVKTISSKGVNAAQFQEAGANLGQTVRGRDIAVEGEIAVGWRIDDFIGAEGHDQICGLGDRCGWIAAETNRTTQRDIVAVQIESPCSGIERDAAGRDA